MANYNRELSKTKDCHIKLDCDWLIYYWSREGRRKRVGSSHSEEARFRSLSISFVIGWIAVVWSVSLAWKVAWRTQDGKKLLLSLYTFIDTSFGFTVFLFYCYSIFDYSLVIQICRPRRRPRASNCFIWYTINQFFM